MVQHNTVSHASPIMLGQCRVMRFIPDFTTDQVAAHDAIGQGLNGVRDTTRAPAHQPN
ncbi:MAG: hypothetical protein HY068_02995 [Burkholderiales bacterium]|nr:hypothetical protein [Burkholderiales bacterium]